MQINLNYFLNRRAGWGNCRCACGLWPLLVLVFLFCAPMSGSAQNITLKRAKTPLSELLNVISRQSGMDLMGDRNLLKKLPVVTVDFQGEPLVDVLAQLSSNQPFLLELKNKTIIVQEKPNAGKSFLHAPTKGSQEFWLKGKIVDPQGNALSGVTLKLVGSKNNTVSDEQGHYALLVKPNSQLMVTMLGFQPLTVVVGTANVLDLTLLPRATDIDEVVATGYSNVRKENFTGAATIIKRKDIEKFNSNNIFSVIQALDPSFKVDEGVDIGSNPNALPQINIRGVSSVGEYAVNAPLVIIDGFESSLQTLYDIDVNRVESVAILKDASSTSLYGSRGGNGVIVIETRMPKDGKYTITYEAKPSISLVDLSDYNLMNAGEKLRYESLAGIYSQKGTDVAWDHIYQEQLNNLYTRHQQNVLEGVDTYWIKQPVRNTFSVNNSLRMEGGGNDVRYSLEGNYNDFKGVMKGSGRVRAGAGFNLIYRIPNVFTFRNIASYNYAKEYNSPYGNFSDYTQLNPYERMYDDLGNPIIRFSDIGMYEFGPAQYNPLYNATLGFRDDNRQHQLSNNLSLEWLINSSFTLRGRGSIARTMSNADVYKSPFNTSFINETDPNKKGSYLLSERSETNYEGRLDFQYATTIGKHQVTSNIIGELRSGNVYGNSHLLTGFVDDRFQSPQMALQYAHNSLPISISKPTRSLGFVGSAYYSYNNTYNLSGTFRSDGSSIYGRENRFGHFWSVGASYNVHNEKWFDSKRFNRFRLFANLGTNSTESFNANMVNTYYKFVASDLYYNQYAAIYSGQGNNKLRWPELSQLSLGLDVSAFADLINVTASYYAKTTDRMISPITVAPSFGFAENTYFQNLGKTSNKGFEVNANVRLMQDMTKDMSWYISVGLVQNRSKLLEISNELRELNESLVAKDDEGNVIKPTNYYEEGQSLTNIYAVPSLGIDPATGRELFLNRNGDVSYTWSANNQEVVGNKEPTLFGNLSTAFNYKGFSLQVIGNYSIGGDIYNQTLMDKIENNSPYHNGDKRLLEGRWQNPGDQVMYKAVNDLTFTQVTSRFVQKESFLRVSAININYNFPQELIRKYKLERLKLNFSANDMFRLSTVRMERGVSYPYARSFNFGLMLQF